MFRLLVGFLLFTGLCHAQGPTSVWTLGDSLTLTFDSTAGPSVSGMHSMYGIESVATLSDESGNLLAYSNGATLWNRADSVMFNSEDLSGPSVMSSASSGTVFIPADNSQGLYWYLVIGAEGAFPGDTGGIALSLIDMSLDGGLGGIVDTFKDRAVRPAIAEYLHVVRHSNGEDWWIYTRPDSSSAFLNKDLLTRSGFVRYPPEHIGFTLSSKVGNLSSSPNGCYLGIAGYGESTSDSGAYAVLEIDRANGQLALLDYVKTKDLVYGLAFAPNSELLYVGRISPPEILQIDYLSAPEFSVEVIYSNPTNLVGIGQFRNGDDGKIYFPVSSNAPPGTNIVQDDFLGAIERPNVRGVDCVVNPSYLFLDASRDQYAGLPAFPNYVADLESCQDTVVASSFEQVKPVNGNVFENNVGMQFSILLPEGSIEIYNSSGQLISRELVQFRVLDLSGLDPGVYYIRQKLTSGRSQSQRIVVGQF